MTVNGVSSASIGQSMRAAMARRQADLNTAQKEMSSGRFADLGLQLGAQTRESVSLNRDFERLDNIADTNALVSGRLSASQSALTQLGKGADSFLSALTVSLSGGSSASHVQDTARNTLGTLTSLLNTSFNGEYVFGGINTGSAPLNDWSASGSPARQAFRDSFQAKFGFAPGDPQAAGISGADMNSFLDGVEDQFLGPGWGQNWSNATDEGIVGRIGLNETAQTSVSANDKGIRKLAFAAAVVSELGGSSLGGGGRSALLSRAVSLAGEATGDIAAFQANTGLLQARVSGASDRVKAQSDLISSRIQALESVDPYEASTRVNDLLQQIQTSYALTARIQQLSLAQYLT